MAETDARYSTVLIEKGDLDLLREAKHQLLLQGVDCLAPALRAKVMNQIGKDKMEAFSRGTLVAISLLALLYLLEKKEVESHE